MLSSVSCVSAVQCWAVGELGPTGGGGGGNFRPQALIESWNGSSWSIEPSPNVAALSFLNTRQLRAGGGVPGGRELGHVSRKGTTRACARSSSS